MRKFDIFAALIGLFLALSGFNLAYADDDDDDDEDSYYETVLQFQNHLARDDYTLRLEPLGLGLMGDSIDNYTGTPVFTHTDVSIPGNSGLEVAIKRSVTTRAGSGGQAFLMGDWELMIPNISYRLPKHTDHAYSQLTNWHNNRCSKRENIEHSTWGYKYIPLVGSGTSLIAGNVPNVEFYEGLNLNVPGHGSQKLLEHYSQGSWYSTFDEARWSPFIWRILEAGKGANDVSRVTTNHWVVGCSNDAVNDTGRVDSDGAGEGFLAYAPDGTQYKFNRLTYQQIDDWADWGNTLINTRMPMVRAVMYATEVTDPNGNWVKYEYSTDGRLTRIHSNDGREITLAYSPGTKLVSSVTANGRTISYSYENRPITMQTGTTTRKTLDTVTLPDGTYWEFDLDELTDHLTGLPNACDNLSATVSIQHPYGVSASYQLDTALIEATGDRLDHNDFPLVACNSTQSWYKTVAVIAKTLSGPSIPTSNWQYAYNRTQLNLQSYILPLAYGDTTITKPDGQVEVVTYYPQIENSSQINPFTTQWPKKVSNREIFDSLGGNLLEQKTFKYIVSDLFGEEDVIEDLHGGDGNLSNSQALYTSEVVTTRGGDTYTTEFEYDIDPDASTYSYGKPTKVTRKTSNTSVSRIADTTYTHKKNEWVIGLLNTVTHNNKLFDQYGYDSLGRMLWHDRFGSRSTTLTYNSDGTFNTAKDALNRITTLANWKRGWPQTITQANGTSASRVVDNNGWVTSSTNARGFTTSLEHNIAGWLTKISRPGSWADTIISYNLSGSGVSQTITRGNAREIVTYDNLHRPTLEQKQDLTGHSAPIYTKTEYDALDRPIFTSWPSHSANPTAGVDTSYDALGRVTQTQETVAPNATTAYEYLAGNKIRVTDPVGAQTTTTYRAFGRPSTSEAMTVLDATGTTTTMTRDIYGNITNLNQSSGLNGYSVNVDRKFWYDSRLRLCRHRAPEFGDELFVYDAADQMINSSRGEAAASGCAVPTTSLKTIYHYDNMGRQNFINYRPGTEDIAKTYDANGNLLTVNRGGINWTYAYNELDLMTQETLGIDGRNYQISHNYDTTGNLYSRRWPVSGDVVFNANGFGQPTEMTLGTLSYASNLSYHANGTLAAASHLNGGTYSQSLTPRQQLYEIKTYMGSNLEVFLRHHYDARGKVTSIPDYVTSGQNRTFSYDARGRLLTANGSWGNGSFDYDGLDNIREKVLGSRTVDISYNNSTNLVTQVNDSAESSVRIYSYDSFGNVKDNGPIRLNYDWAFQPVSSQANGVWSYHTYDGNLKRVKTIQNGETTYWVYSALTGTPLYSDNITSNEQTRYMSAGGVKIRLNGSNSRYIYSDHQGSPIMGTNAAGTVLWREHYLPFGEKTLDPAANQDQPGYTGHVQDDASGLTYMQARYYDPVASRFLSTDPIGYQDQLNLYAYVANDPINHTDPTGTMCPECNVVNVVWATENPEHGMAALNAVSEGYGRGIVATGAIGAAAVTAPVVAASGLTGLAATSATVGIQGALVSTAISVADGASLAEVATATTGGGLTGFATGRYSSAAGIMNKVMGAIAGFAGGFATSVTTDAVDGSLDKSTVDHVKSAGVASVTAVLPSTVIVSTAGGLADSATGDFEDAKTERKP